MGNGSSQKKTRPAFPMYEKNYEKIITPSGKKTGEEQLEYIKENEFIKRYEEPYTEIEGYTLEYYIPKGTKLYHGSFIYYQKFDRDQHTYFGIDIIIALWYLHETAPSDINYGYIYEFDVIKDIPVYILNSIDNHPKNVTICKDKQIACIHPQYAYRSHPPHTNEKEMSTELTMNLNQYKIGEYIERTIHPKTKSEIIYLVSIERLLDIADKNKNFSEYNPIHSAIMGMVIPPKNNSNKKGDHSVLRKSRKAKHANAAAARSTSKSRSRSRSKSTSKSRSRSTSKSKSPSKSPSKSSSLSKSRK